jgi:predicted enzyme related to lactoylglutathione lyase
LSFRISSILTIVDFNKAATLKVYKSLIFRDFSFMKAVKKIAMVIVMQNDLQAAVDFYKTLGLTLVFHVKDRWAEFNINDLQIGLCPTEEKINLNRTGIVFETSDLNAFYDAHKESLNFLDKPTQAAHGLMASIQDPSGNILDLYEPTPEKIKELAEKLGADACCNQEEDSCCRIDSNQGGCC